MKLVYNAYLGPKGGFVNGERKCVVDFSVKQHLKSVYEALKLDYPKFHKMDVLSKLLILTEEMTQDFKPTDVGLDDNLSLIMANHSSSALTDQRFIESYTVQQNPSPSLFVYTLPNIALGELSIRRKWFGENSFFICEQFDAEFFIRQCRHAFLLGNRYTLCAWIEADVRGNEECFLFLVTDSDEEKLEELLIHILNTYRNE